MAAWNGHWAGAYLRGLQPLSDSGLGGAQPVVGDQADLKYRTSGQVKKWMFYPLLAGVRSSTEPVWRRYRCGALSRPRLSLTCRPTRVVEPQHTSNVWRGWHDGS